MTGTRKDFGMDGFDKGRIRQFDWFINFITKTEIKFSNTQAHKERLGSIQCERSENSLEKERD